MSARWLQSDREVSIHILIKSSSLYSYVAQWVTSDAGVPTRLPMLGPLLPLLNPVLIVVTESHLCNIHYIHPQTDSVKMLGASLRRKSTSKEGNERHPGEQTEGPRGMGRCIRATIGFGYDGEYTASYSPTTSNVRIARLESSIIIATQSVYLPSSGLNAASGSAVDMSMSMPITSPLPEPAINAEWNSWSAENVIELCEVSISVHGVLLSPFVTLNKPV